MEKLTLKELHHLIEEHQQKDPRHAIQDLKDWGTRWGINYPGTDIWQHTHYLNSIWGDRKATQEKWKSAYRAHRKYENYDRFDFNQDPGGCHGRYE